MTDYSKGISIGKVKLSGRVILAPMAGVTDLPFRLLCKEQGADLICTEMVSAKGIYYNNKNTEDLLKIQEEERPVSLQLFGSDPEICSQMAKRIEERNFDILDFNMGCPVPKVVNNGEGSALLKNIPLAAKIVEKTVQAISKPVTVKIRKGFLRGETQAVEMARALEEAGASAIAIHGRTREEYYSGQADWDIIGRVKEEVSIPVIGNGDIRSPLDAERMMRETGCDAVMIGRAARGNPWIFHQMKTYFETGVLEEKPEFSLVIDTILRHAKMQTEWKGELRGMREMRTHVASYTAGYPHSGSLRRAMNGVETMSQLTELLEAYR
ncbi:MAG: tRNA dihydrouridine synthase DusB [Eubacterium sp.]|nr:tRNA dihydrouridine synthase DusB [Eubacterium sp.]